MLGRSMELTFPQPPEPSEDDAPPALQVEHLAVGPVVVDMSFHVRRGEIVGIAGLVGSGRSEALRAVFGADQADAGRVTVAGTDYVDRTPLHSVERGLGMIPEDRRGQGLVGGMSIRANVSLADLRRFVRGGLVSRAKERASVMRLMDQIDILPRRPETSVATLSGGNQQKVLFAKWLSAKPSVLLLDEPTRGVDIGAKRNIYDLIVALADEGIGIILVSSELEEVMSLSRRVYLVHDGCTIDEVDPSDISEDEVLFRLFGLDTELVSA